jgi:hypothetical protein
MLYSTVYVLQKKSDGSHLSACILIVLGVSVVELRNTATYYPLHVPHIINDEGPLPTYKCFAIFS